MMHIDTVPGDRVVVHDNTKLLLNQINGNFLNTLNQYVDSFYVPLRNVFPTNYEKLIPNPVKGEDLPNSALPVVPLLSYFRDLYNVDQQFDLQRGSTIRVTDSMREITEGLLEDTGITYFNDLENQSKIVYTGRLLLLATILSRGQLLDYLGFALDNSRLSSRQSSELQNKIDSFFRQMWDTGFDGGISVGTISLTDNLIVDSDDYLANDSLEQFRSNLSDILEAGKFPVLDLDYNDGALRTSIRDLVICFESILNGFDVGRDVTHLDTINSMDTINTEDTHNIGKILAYQQIIAHYYTNDHVDNVFSSDLYMQNLRSIMYPSEEGMIATVEPTFEMNGVRYEYDYISYGGFWSSLMSDVLVTGYANRQFVFGTLMFLLRRSLRFGDYFSTARPNMLAVSDQLGIAVDGGMVSPIDVTKNLLMQRYLNAANYIGQGFLQYMSSIYGVKPSDTGCIPRFISHRKIELQNQITNNTADNQGAQTTNIVGYSDMSAFDVFIDDFGYLISLTSFDVLPIYKSGIDSSYHFSDRFDYFNPMLQGIGDQPIRSSELLGFPELYSNTFGYTMRNAEYKYKLSKAHGAFVNSLPGFMISYPIYAYNSSADEYDIHIDPDFIRDKPIYIDPLVPQMTGISPAEYFHFIVSCTNQVQCARKIQATPGVLF